VKLVPELPISDSDIIIVYQLFDECRQRKAQSQQSSSVGKDILSIIPAKGKRRQGELFQTINIGFSFLK
jgi:hypothetical protein